MFLQRFAVHRPVTLVMCIIASIVFGVLSFNQLGLDLLPNLEYPTLAVVTAYPNADPESIEQEVTRHIESTLSTVSDLKTLESISLENASLVLAHFHWGTDLAKVYEEINSLVSIAEITLPDEVTRPLVLKLDPSQLPLLQIGITGDDDIVSLTERIEQHVLPTLERTSGVAQASVLGGERTEIALYYDTDALRDAMLTPLDLQNMLQAQNVTVPVGSMRVAPDEFANEQADTTLRYPIRVGNTLRDENDLLDLIISIPSEQQATDSFGLSGLLPPRPIRLGDVVTLAKETTKGDGFTRINGQPAVLVRILKQSGENTVDVSQQVIASLSQLEQHPELANLDFHIVTNQADLITESIDNLSSTAILGGILALLILFLFLRSFRDLLVIGVSIPLSIMLALIFMNLAGLTLNLMTLGGLAIAIGMLVDNSIVVLENIFRLRLNGMKPLEAAKQGAYEMTAAITASTLTSIVVFLPLLFVGTLAGIFFRELALTITFSLVASLLVALTVVPMLAAHLPARWGRKRSAESTPRLKKETRLAVLERIKQHYVQLLRWSAKRPYMTLIALLVLMSSLFVLPRFLESGFLPPMDGGIVNIELQLPTGTDLQETNQTVQNIERMVEQLPETQFVTSQVGNQNATDFLSLVQDSPIHHATITVSLKHRKERMHSAHDIADMLSETLVVPDGSIVHISADRATDALGEEYAVGQLLLELRGPEWEQLASISDEVAGILRTTKGFGHVTSTAEEIQPQLFYEVNHVQAARALLTAGQVGLTMRAAMTGLEATTLQIDGRRMPVVIRPKQENIQNVEALGSYRVFNLQRDDEGIPSVSRFSVLTSADAPTIELAPRSIEHVDRQRVVRVRAQLDGLDLTSSSQVAQRIVEDLELPPGYEVSIAGIHATLTETLHELSFALAFAVLLVFMVMAAQFESIKHPFIIMGTLPLAGIGALLALWMTKQQLNVPSLMGLITLMGISVNNGIVFIDTMNRFRRQGLPVIEAIVSAGTIRIRPVLMTALTTVLGLLPLAFGWGEGTEIHVPLAISTIGGLVMSTVITLVMIPSAYSLLTKWTERNKQSEA